LNAGEGTARKAEAERGRTEETKRANEGFQQIQRKRDMEKKR